MSMQRVTLSLNLTALMLLASCSALSQQYPVKSVRIVTAGVGGAVDVVARLIAGGLTTNLKQQVIVDNRGSTVPAEIVAKALPDGYTLLLVANNLWTSALLRKTPPYDPVNDFAPVTLALSFPTLLFVNASVPANSVKEFIVLAKSRPGELNYVMTSPGASAHLAAELFKAMAGVNLTAVSYKNASTGIVDLVGGRVQLFFSAAGPLMPLVKSGKLKVLAMTSAKPSTLFPDLPTVAATLPGYEMTSSYCVFAPARTPTAIINLLNREIVRVLHSPESKVQIDNNGFELVASSSEELAAMRQTDIARVRKLIKDAGLPIED